MNERKYELYDHDFKANSHRVFAAMRERDPMLSQIGMDGKTQIWFISRHAEVERILRDEVTFS